MAIGEKVNLRTTRLLALCILSSILVSGCSKESDGNSGKGVSFSQCMLELVNSGGTQAEKEQFCKILSNS